MKAISTATRIIIIGFSMPMADTHFKYLLAAGLQEKISLRKFLFINPALDGRNPKERDEVRANLFGILRPELEERGIVELKAQNTREFFLKRKQRNYQTRNCSILFPN